MNERPIVLVSTKGFWNECHKVNTRIFHGKFHLAFDELLEAKNITRENVAAIVLGDQPVASDILNRFPNLKTIARTGTGYDNIDMKETRKRGIVVTRVAKLNAEAVSEFALGLLFALTRNIFRLHADMAHGRWNRRAGFLLSELSVGVVGLGTIGSSIARRLHFLGAKRLLGWNRKFHSEAQLLSAECHVELVPLDELCAESDVVIIALALASGTKGLVGEKLLAVMKPTAFLINVSRGAVVDEDTLADMVLEDRIGGIALDVYSVEPPSSGLFDKPFMRKLKKASDAGKNVILTPHNAYLTTVTVERVSLKVAENILAVLEGRVEDAEVIQ